MGQKRQRIRESLSEMFIIGLTGSFGTGKSTVAAMFAQAGAKVIDADTVTRHLLQEKKCIKRVAKVFSDVILDSGDIDRNKLSNIVFQNPRELKKLTDILYPEALKEVKKQISLYQHAPLIILDVPLLFEAGWEKLADTTIVVCAGRKQQIQRLQKRLAVSRNEILKRLKFQMPLKEKCLMADMIIDNNGLLNNTRKQVDAIMDRLLKRK